MTKIIVMLIGFLSFTGFPQQESYHDTILIYFKWNGTTQQYSRAIDQLFTMLPQQYQKANVPDHVWKTLQDEVQPIAIRSIHSLLATVYQQHFSHQEIMSLIDFYASETGQQLVADASQLTDIQKQKATTFYTTAVGKKVQQQGESLKQNVSEASELWSRDVYTQVQELLEAKGYLLPK